MSKPFLSVVTRSCGRTKLLARNKKSLAVQIDPDFEQVIIVDKEHKGLHEANKSLNLNKHRVKGRYVLILDDDNYISDRSFIKHLKHTTTQHPVDIILFKVYRKPFSETLPSKRSWGKQPLIGEIDSCCLVVKNAVWQKYIHEFGRSKHGDYYFIKTLFEKKCSRYWVSRTMIMIDQIGDGKCTPSEVVVSPDVAKEKVKVSSNVEKVYPQVTVVLVNYCTKELTNEARRTMLLFYPQISMIMIDNGSKDDSTADIRIVGEEYPNIMVILNKKNIGHGPALNQGLRLARTPYVFLYDSDASLQSAGLLEAMLAEFAKNPKKLYAVGWLRQVDKFSGVSTGGKGGMSYIHPHAALIDREKFLQLTPMEASGAPCVGNMRTALESGYQLKDFPVQRYVKHLVAGTRRMFHGNWKPDGAMRAWKAGDHYPI